MGNLKDELENFDFHYSNIESIKLYQNENLDNCCGLRIKYYNWEGNINNDTNWDYKEFT